jgi:phosphinothricin acetyltransferase
MRIRPATVEDSAQIAAIYAPFVEHSHVSFEENAPDAAEMRERIASYTEKYPWLVAEERGQILGYAYACAHRSRAAYRWSVDSAIYVRESAQGRGVGKALYSELFRILKLQGFRSVYAGVSLPNDASIALHRSLGFAEVGIYRRVGYKDGAWRDTLWWQLQLDSDDARPEEPVQPGEVES